MKTVYEWLIEFIDEHGDIVNTDHDDSLAKLVRRYEVHFPLNESICIALVKDVGDNVDGLVEREWSYIDKDYLPRDFTDGEKVPQKYISEFERVYREAKS